MHAWHAFVPLSADYKCRLSSRVFAQALAFAQPNAFGDDDEEAEQMQLLQLQCRLGMAQCAWQQEQYKECVLQCKQALLLHPGHDQAQRVLQEATAMQEEEVHAPCNSHRP